MAQADYPEPVIAVVDELKRLPGIGPRSAERIALWLLQSAKARPAAISETLQAAVEKVSACHQCGFFATA